MWENSVEMETRQWAIKRRQKREPKRFQEGCAWTLGATIPQNAPKTKLIETRELPHFTFTLGKSEDNGTSSTTELSVGDKSSSCPEEREWCMPQKNSGVIAECLCLQAVWEEGSEILGWGVGEGLAGGLTRIWWEKDEKSVTWTTARGQERSDGHWWRKRKAHFQPHKET